MKIIPFRRATVGSGDTGARGPAEGPAANGSRRQWSMATPIPRTTEFSQDLVRNWQTALDRLEAAVMIHLVEPGSRRERQALRNQIAGLGGQVLAARRSTWGWPFEAYESLKGLEKKARYLVSQLDRLDREAAGPSPQRW